MRSVICTLFEGHYHAGLAGLINSLYQQSFKGSVYAGYKGKLPAWASAAKEDRSIGFGAPKILELGKQIRLYFIPLDTSYHLTNYKPDFMLSVLGALGNSADALFYFDPDIIITQPWVAFEEWVQCGVALSEDVNSPLPDNHPLRSAWRTYYTGHGYTLSYRSSIYVNGGFVGVSSAQMDFLSLWQQMQESMGKAIGGLGNSAFSNGGQLPEQYTGIFSPFGKTDQDALNATVEAYSGKISLIGKEAMGFAPGGTMMLHALGQPKPWQRASIQQAFAGNPPRRVDREYWNYARGPIRMHPSWFRRYKSTSLLIAKIIGRFYHR